MFSRFLKHDIRYGILNQKVRLIVTFILFFCLSSYHFLILRIYELTNPEYFTLPVTTSDYFLALTGGIGKVEIIAGGESDFTMPAMWLVFVLWILFFSLYYPFNDLHGIGKHMMILSGGREIWCLSKCVWVALNTTVSYMIIFFASFCSALCFGAKPSLSANRYLARELNMQTELLTSETIWNIAPIIFLTLLSLIALSLVQFLLSITSSPLSSFLLITGYLLAGTYFQSPALLGNFTMAARNSLLVTTGLSTSQGIFISLWAIVLSVILAIIKFQRKDIIGGE